MTTTNYVTKGIKLRKIRPKSKSEKLIERQQWFLSFNHNNFEDNKLQVDDDENIKSDNKKKKTANAEMEQLFKDLDGEDLEDGEEIDSDKVDENNDEGLLEYQNPDQDNHLEDQDFDELTGSIYEDQNDKLESGDDAPPKEISSVICNNSGLHNCIAETEERKQRKKFSKKKRDQIKKKQQLDVVNGVYRIQKGLIMENKISSLSVTCNSTEAELSCADHPRFAKYFKNYGKYEEQQRNRREAHMTRKKEISDEWMNRRRGLDLDSSQETEMEGLMNSFDPRARRRRAYLSRYKNMLMFSDWLVDIPGTLSSEWTMMASPVGRRCLVVGRHHKTNVFHKNDLTILDCICEDKNFKETSKYYVLDCKILWWDDKMYTDTEFTIRQFFLRTKLEELNKEGNGQFIPLQTCPCLPEAMTEFMKTEFPFQLDGLLFYFNSAIYIPEQTPLVGWLKPWMLPELLGIKIPEYLQQYNKPSRVFFEFIEDFNKFHCHKSSIQLNAEKEKKAQEDEEAQLNNENKKEKEKKKEKNKNKNGNINSDNVEEVMDCVENN
ncbi:IBB domain-containing protein [Meloidogyne graminicola]|uniref:Snurportin-1 n=1 Tax=Meloidogyne graminicola TaxID=189291 RepID=A0A8S9ZEB0_9BILA|nr:IBB domain-containing protein [Meloidogyne graminicola]